MKKEKLLTIQEVAVTIGTSVETINTWYRWKRREPYHELAQILPEPIQETSRATRYWNQSDVWKLIEFKSKIKVGRNGVMGSVTQQYVRNREEKKDE